MSRLITSSIVLLLGLAVAGTPARGQQARWFKGQLHAHTTNSDGDEWPPRVARWYQDHGYNFLAITDHNQVTDGAPLDTDGDRDGFILIPSEEVTDRNSLHVCGFNLLRVVDPQHGEGTVLSLQKNVDAIREAGGIAQVNHPNWKRTVKCEDLSAVKNATLLEVYNLDKFSNNFAAGGAPGTEEIWDCVLSRGVPVYGVATDDAHDYEGEYRVDRSPPGRGWVMVRARDLNVASIIEALQAGDFYGTGGLGVVLDDLQVSDREYRLRIRPQEDLTFTTRFIGRDGAVLQEDQGLEPVYRFKGDELYVRAKVLCSSGDFAITQPVFPPKTR